MDYNEFNYQLEELKSKIFKILEESNLPLGAIFYLFKDIYNDLNNQYIATVNSYSINRSENKEQYEQIILPKGNSQVE